MPKFYLKGLKIIIRNYPVRSGIRTHARKTGLRPERSALDRSAILTHRFANLMHPMKYSF